MRVFLKEDNMQLKFCLDYDVGYSMMIPVIQILNWMQDVNLKQMALISIVLYI